MMDNLWRPIELRKKIGLQLKQARIDKGLSQEKLGKLLGITHPAIGAYESGRLRITIEQLVVLCKLLDKPVSFFLADDPTAVKKYNEEKLAQKPNYDLNDNLEFSLEMSIRNYLRANNISGDLNAKVDEIMSFINDKLSNK